MTVSAPFVLGDLNKAAGLEPIGNGYVPAEPAELRLDWADQGGGTYKPVYVGRAQTGTATSASTWSIQRLHLGRLRLRVQGDPDPGPRQAPGTTEPPWDGEHGDHGHGHPVQVQRGRGRR